VDTVTEGNSISEGCSCGAFIELKGARASILSVEEWRKTHRHEVDIDEDVVIRRTCKHPDFFNLPSGGKRCRFCGERFE
jgi:hypothetical protein